MSSSTFPSCSLSFACSKTSLFRFLPPPFDPRDRWIEREASIVAPTSSDWVAFLVLFATYFRLQDKEECWRYELTKERCTKRRTSTFFGRVRDRLESRRFRWDVYFPSDPQGLKKKKRKRKGSDGTYHLFGNHRARPRRFLLHRWIDESMNHEGIGDRARVHEKERPDPPEDEDEAGNEPRRVRDPIRPRSTFEGSRIRSTRLPNPMMRGQKDSSFRLPSLVPRRYPRFFFFRRGRGKEKGIKKTDPFFRLDRVFFLEGCRFRKGR